MLSSIILITFFCFRLRAILYKYTRISLYCYPLFLLSSRLLQRQLVRHELQIQESQALLVTVALEILCQRIVCASSPQFDNENIDTQL